MAAFLLDTIEPFVRANPGVVIPLIDADMLAFIACKKRSRVESEEEPFTEAENAEYLEKSVKNAITHINGILDMNYSDNYMLFIKGEDNFREIKYPTYKQARRAKPSPVWPGLVRQALFEMGIAIKADGYEADDFIRIYHNKILAWGGKPIVVTGDKDLQIISGNHFNIRTNVRSSINQMESNRFFYQQLLMGDNVDSVPGIPGLGPRKSQRMLEGCSSEAELQEVVSLAYFATYGKEDDAWKKELLFNGEQLYILKDFDDKFQIDNWKLSDIITAPPRPATPQVTEGSPIAIKADIAKVQQTANTEATTEAAKPIPSAAPKLGVPGRVPSFNLNKEPVPKTDENVQTPVIPPWEEDKGMAQPAEAKEDNAISETVSSQQQNNTVGIEQSSAKEIPAASPAPAVPKAPILKAPVFSLKK